MKVLIAVDDSEESRHAVDTAYQFFGAGADYSVLSVGSRAPIYVGGYGVGAIPTAADLTVQLDAAHDAAKGAADDAAGRIPGGVEADVADGDAGAVICAYADEHAADLIVIGSRDRSFWERLFDPSVGRHVVDHAPCPVLVVR